MLKIAITVNPNKDKELTYTRQLLDLLSSQDVTVMMSEVFKSPYNGNTPVAESLLANYKIEYYPEHIMFRKADICIVFGGDGTILKIAKRASQGGAYILGINLGKVGYIAELEVTELELIKSIISLGSVSKIEQSKNITIDKRMMLKAEIVRNGRTVYSANALNDVVISKGAVSRMAGLRLMCDGKSISSYRADGIIISTPTGSTAYCMSAGGPIIDPDLECICAVPVCPYMCINPGAVVFSDNSVIEVEFKADKINEAFCTIDGVGAKTIYDGDIIRITKSAYYTKLLRLKDNDFYSVLNQKLGIANTEK